MKEFFYELKQKDEVRNCSSMLICIGMLQDDSLTIGDMGIINDFLDDIYSDNMEVKWGAKNNLKGERMSLLVVCAKEKKNCSI